MISCNICLCLFHWVGFSDSSVGKESACNAGDSSLIPGSGRSAGEGIGYPLQYSWASLVAQLVKNPPAMQETWVWSLGWEDALEKGKATHSSILAGRILWDCRVSLEKAIATYSSTLAWKIPWMEEPVGLLSMGLHRVGHNWSDLPAAAAAAKSDMTERLSLSPHWVR